MKKLLLVVLTLVLFSATYASAEEFVTGWEPAPIYRPDTGITIAFPILNKAVWPGGKSPSFEGSLYNFYVNESTSPDKGKIFMHIVIWSLNKDDKANFVEFVKGKYKALVQKELASLKMEDEITVVDDVKSFTTQDGMYNAESVELQVYSLKKAAPASGEPEGEEKWTKNTPFNCAAFGLYDSVTGKYFVMMATASDVFYPATKRIIEGIVAKTYFGQHSNAGLVAMLLILIGVLVAGAVFFVVNEKRKSADRKRRLRNLHEDEYDDYEDDDDDYDRGGRGGRSREPERNSRGSRTPDRNSRNSGGQAPRRSSRSR